ncbi:MAG: hypothetical protein JWQ81_936 [Amycolatopsis sp.]|uniref:hypothetical protein n=1 Tax=Amycolatopsis sp. TaxID=37632 RepID=UPI002628AA0F|nr:hypothetical protein [Amycolatopsis sp.]MCU1680197.1 hypothetical protein [Amycolatopsis sp.]
MSTPDYSPDGLTCDDITELQRDVTAELRREGHLPRQRRRRRTSAARPRDAARAQAMRSPRAPAARRGHRRGDHR